ncbi:Exopolyphosphatase [Tulasnella sp. 419]|nr:Exopolyphosphatase [Tulasnella sp. 418]KAG8958806.1 Exopolyphosphatase [Tulasnella sp. 419]
MTRLKLAWVLALLGFGVLCMRLFSFLYKLPPPYVNRIGTFRPRPSPPTFSSSSFRKMGKLSEFLVSNKASFLEDVKNNKGGNWTVVMGNEAGDLDTVASSIAYSYLATSLRNDPTVALIQTPHSDLYLRPENLFAFQIAGLDAEQRDLLCVDDLPTSTTFPKIALVDHNRLNPAFEGDSVKVVGVIDHHADEGLYKDANPRDITPVGSCASLVARDFQHLWTDSPVPQEVATLLLSAIYIDTAGLKPGDKAVDIDRAAASFLSKHSTLPEQPQIGLIGEEPGLSLATLAKALSSRKKDIDNLSTRDLLRRDYKQWIWGGLSTGISTVPCGSKDWLDKDAKFWEGLDAYLDEKKLSILGVLTTFKDKKEKRREVLFLLRSDVPQELETKLWNGLESSEELQLEKKKKVEVEGNRRAKVWNQRNVTATRKQIAPLVQSVLEGQASTSAGTGNK